MGQPTPRRRSLEQPPVREVDTAEDLAEAKKLVQKHRNLFGSSWRIWKVRK